VPSDLNFAIGAAKILAIDLALAGDNALVIAMAARTLDPSQRRAAILIGAVLAVVIRVLATIFVTGLLGVPWLSAIGGLLVAWIAVRLVVEDEEAAGAEHRIQGFWHAVRVIAAADFIMSLDNILAVGGASGGHFELVIFGLLVSIPLVIFCSRWIAELLERFPVLAEVGAAILGYTAGEMVLADIVRHPNSGRGLVPAEALGWAVHGVEWGLRLGMAVLVVTVARVWLAARRRRARLTGSHGPTTPE
jgi:YjbE family integral membrane protein